MSLMNLMSRVWVYCQTCHQKGLQILSYFLCFLQIDFQRILTLQRMMAEIHQRDSQIPNHWMGWHLRCFLNTQTKRNSSLVCFCCPTVIRRSHHRSPMKAKERLGHLCPPSSVCSVSRTSLSSHFREASLP